MSEKKSSIPKLGIGIALRDQFFDDIELLKKEVDLVEVMVDNYLSLNKDKLLQLKEFSSDVPLVFHGVQLNIGSEEDLDMGYLEVVHTLIKILNPAWYGEHMSMVSLGDVSLGHLTPIPLCKHTADSICRKADIISDKLGIPFVLENITCPFLSPWSEWEEIDFINYILSNSSSKLLLDVTNLYANSVNHGFDPFEYIESIPRDSVVQVHFTGGKKIGECYYDTHDQKTPIEIWELLDCLLSSHAVNGVILERDDNEVRFEELIPELEKARKIGEKYGQFSCG